MGIVLIAYICITDMIETNHVSAVLFRILGFGGLGKFFFTLGGNIKVN